MELALAFLVFIATMLGTLVVVMVLPIGKQIRNGEIRLMAKLDDVRAAIEKAKADITQAINTEIGQVNAAVVALKDAINAGSAATPEQLDALIDQINGITGNVIPTIDKISDVVK